MSSSDATSASAASATSVQLNPHGMQYVRVGKSGLKVSKITLGCMTYGTPKWREWVLDYEQSKPFIRKALECGINAFDTSDMYSAGESERVLGRCLKEFGTKREDVVIMTKLYFPSEGANGPNAYGLSRKHIFDAIDASLKRLQMDYVDLLQIHRWDNDTDYAEVMEALHDVVKSGRARYIGASSMYCWQFQHCQNLAEKNRWTKFISMQNHYNAVYREEEREMNPYCAFSGVGLLPWSPLARGFLCGKRAPTTEATASSTATVREKTDNFGDEMYHQPEDHVILDRVIEIATKKGVKPAQVALAWLLQQNAVTSPIIGASKMYQLEEAIAAIQIKLEPEEVKHISEKYKVHPVLGRLS